MSNIFRTRSTAAGECGIRVQRRVPDLDTGAIEKYDHDEFVSTKRDGR